ncbi:hypothetical protein DWG14_07446 [Streptomyces griseorubiginosus]|uniref:Uncharacterized protein n=1 Tax=Streptomyces griseorubiginosus TaxID=67304 RepID=A0AAI8L7R2_9ACTN|nr:hypothetical protein DWG14_07446 [Streptomyces griseorubiginosus]
MGCADLGCGAMGCGAMGCGGAPCDAPGTALDRVTEHQDRPVTGGGRFASGGLLRRRRPGADAAALYPRRDLPRTAGDAPRPPEVPLPARLLLLPAGFEPASPAAVLPSYDSTVTTLARILPDAVPADR